MNTGSNYFRNIFSRFLRDESGATAMEYGLIVAILSVVIIAGFGAIGETTRDDIYGRIATALNSALGSGDAD